LLPTGMSILNSGEGADTTTNLLWRIENGNLPLTSPKFITVLIGTNNSVRPNQSGEIIADGIATILEK